LSVNGIDFSELIGSLNINIPLSYVYRAQFKWAYVFEGFFFGIFFTCLAAIPPALKASKMEPTDALRTT